MLALALLAAFLATTRALEQQNFFESDFVQGDDAAAFSWPTPNDLDSEKWYPRPCGPCPPPPCPLPPVNHCICPLPSQSLIYRSSSEPPYCQRIYFPVFTNNAANAANSFIQCPVGFRPACSSVQATFLPACPRRRPAQCPAGFRLVRGASGTLQCIRFAAPLNPTTVQQQAVCGAGDYAVCLQIRQPIYCPRPQPIVYNEEVFVGPNGGEVVVFNNGQDL